MRALMIREDVLRLPLPARHKFFLVLLILTPPWPRVGCAGVGAGARRRPPRPDVRRPRSSAVLNAMARRFDLSSSVPVLHWVEGR